MEAKGLPRGEVETGTKQMFALAGIVRRFARSKTWQKVVGGAAEASAVEVPGFDGTVQTSSQLASRNVKMIHWAI